MKATQMRGMPVVSIADAATIGEVQGLVLNPDDQRVVAVRINSGTEGVVKTVSSLEVRVGHDAVTIKDSRSVGEEELTEVNGTIDLATLVGTKVLTHAGNLLGTVEDVELDAELNITGYEIGKGALSNLFGGKSTLPAGKGIHYVKNILMVPDEVIAELERSKQA